MNNTIPPFYVGQEVEAIESQTDGAFKKGDRFTIVAIRKGCCGWNVDIGLINPHPTLKCIICGGHFRIDGKWLFASKRFRAITADIQLVTFKELSEVYITSEN